MSLNDPRWGGDKQGDDKRGGGESGPPDLEEIWRDLNRKLSGAFGRKTGGSGNGGGSDGGGAPSAGAIGGGVALLVGIVFVLWMLTGFYTVDASEKGVVLRFGKFKEITSEGLQWRLPYPFESHEIVNVTQVRTVEVGYRGNERAKDLREALMLTDDENIINIQFAAQYTLNDARAYLFNNRDPEASVKQAAETAMREIVGKSKMDYVLYEGREDVAKKAQLLMQKILDRYDTGIQISKVTLQNAQPPEQVQDAFNDAVKAGQNREQLKNEGQAYANDVIPKARGTAARLLEEATGYSGRVAAQAEGDASRFKQVYAEYSKAPEVTRTRMYLDTMQQIYSNTSKVLVDAKGNGNLLYLPLDKLMQAAGAAPDAPQIAPKTNVPSPDAPAHSDANDSRARDPRARDRGDR
ncbi:FtsH protease activity modulator HflK [Uliginosibacterium sp. H3]|uniref:Protein HflK n=1 Tax=Uliginosibacterium silvisoli TaxID=3114758 RepID=A0ABU6K3K3_9RHOO|nr:FtsH protease activity modulator HflK [Uliginosibacterium sp. H3]